MPEEVCVRAGITVDASARLHDDPGVPEIGPQLGVGRSECPRTTQSGQCQHMNVVGSARPAGAQLSLFRSEVGMSHRPKSAQSVQFRKKASHIVDLDQLLSKLPGRN